MRVALLTEGCYPHVTGGVSTWCDQLIRGLSEHDFTVVAITGGGREQPVWELPPNVRELRCVPLWDWNPARREPVPLARAAFVTTYRPFLRALLNPAADPDRFTGYLQRLFRIAQDGGLSSSLRTDEAVDALLAVWAELHGSAPLSMRDAVDATELIEHLLRPLSAPVVEADVCHAVSNGLPALVGLAAKWRFGTPMVMSEHGVYLRERYLACHLVRYSWPVKTILLALFRRICWSAYAASDVISPVNVYNQRWEVRHGADPDAITTAYNGVQPDSYPPAITEPAVPTIGWVGRLDPLKDVETLLHGFALLRAELPSVVLRLFGPTPPGNQWYEQRLRTLADELGLAGSVTFEGPVRPVSSAYHASTLVALSSISEGLPYTVVEAMMCGRTTVSTEVGGVPEVVGDTGLLVPPRDPAAFARACQRVLADDVLRHRLAKAGRARALELFPLSRMLGTFGDIYAAVTSGPAVTPYRRLAETGSA